MTKKTYDACIVCGYEYWGLSVEGVRSRLHLTNMPYCGKHQELQKLGFDGEILTAQVTMSKDQWDDLLYCVCQQRDRGDSEGIEKLYRIIVDAMQLKQLQFSREPAK